MESASLSLVGLFVLLFLGVLAIAGTGLLIYSIVAKRYWLTASLLLLPLGLIVLVVPAFFIGFRKMEVVKGSAYERQQQIEQEIRFNEINSTDSQPVDPILNGSNDAVAQPAEADAPAILASDQAKYEYSASKPLTADVYPSAAMCIRPLAFQIAKKLRETSQASQPKKLFFRISHKNHSKQLHGEFFTDFKNELETQLPNSTFWDCKENAEANPTDIPIKLTVEFPNIAPEGQPLTGNRSSIHASWTLDDKQDSETIYYTETLWITNPTQYFLEYENQRLVVGTTQRLARSPKEAGTLAIQNANRQARKLGYGSQSQRNQVVDRFTQKLTMPYGELWQEAVLVNVGVDETTAAVARDTIRQKGVPPLTASNLKLPSGRLTTLMLLVLTVGMFGVAWVSNLMTQGYYRSNINHTLVTALLVVFGLLVLGLLIA